MGRCVTTSNLLLSKIVKGWESEFVLEEKCPSSVALGRDHTNIFLGLNWRQKYPYPKVILGHSTPCINQGYGTNCAADQNGSVEEANAQTDQSRKW